MHQEWQYNAKEAYVVVFHLYCDPCPVEVDKAKLICEKG